MLIINCEIMWFGKLCHGCCQHSPQTSSSLAGMKSLMLLLLGCSFNMLLWAIYGRKYKFDLFHNSVSVCTCLCVCSHLCVCCLHVWVHACIFSPRQEVSDIILKHSGGKNSPFFWRAFKKSEQIKQNLHEGSEYKLKWKENWTQFGPDQPVVCGQFLSKPSKPPANQIKMTSMISSTSLIENEVKSMHMWPELKVNMIT